MNYSLYRISKFEVKSLIYKLDVNIYQHFTEQKRQNIEDFQRSTSVEVASKKNGRRKNVNSKQMCLSSQNKRYKKMRWRYRSGVSPTFPQLAGSMFVTGRTGSVLPWKLYFTGKAHKIPQMSYLRRETPAIFRQLNKDAD